MRRWWRAERLSICSIAVAAAVYSVAWRAVTRPMGDSASYRATGLEIVHGWHHLTDRTPGYPLLLWITGSLHHETHLLFLVQLAMHCIAVLLVVRVAHHVGVPEPGRVLIVVLLMTPPEMVSVVYAGSEALTQLLVVVALWLFVRWSSRPADLPLVALGVALAALAWVRPAFQLVVVPVAVAIWLLRGRLPPGSERPDGGRSRAWRALAVMALPAVALTGSLAVFNAVRFDSPGLTPLTGWYLSSRTSEYVERLPASYEPARSILVAERNRQRLQPRQLDAPNYAFAVRARLGDALGRHGPALDRYMLGLNLELISHHPFEYQDAVGQAAARYVQVESEPAVLGLGHAVGWLLALVHVALALAFAVQALLLPGLLLRGAGSRPLRAMLAFVTTVALSAAVVATMTETGSSRLRVPTDPLLVLALVAGWWMLTQEWRRRPQTAPVPAESPDPTDPR